MSDFYIARDLQRCNNSDVHGMWTVQRWRMGGANCRNISQL